MPKKAGIVLLAAGAVLIGSALLLLFHNNAEDRTAGQEAERLLVDVKSAIALRTSAAPPETDAPAASDANPAPSASDVPPETDVPVQSDAPEEMPIVNLDGERYIGILDIPALNLSLPIMADWNETRLRRTPCRQFGSLTEENLVIAGHNYRAHFARLRSLKAGDTVLFLDMNGVTHSFRVNHVEILPEDAVDAVQNSGYPLTLYTCTTGAEERVVVFCEHST